MSKDSYYGFSLGLVAIAIGVLQGMYTIMPPLLGWTLVGAASIGSVVMLVLGIRRKADVQYKTDVNSNKAKAEAIHTTLIGLEKSLWLARDNVPAGINPLDNMEVRNIFSNIQTETNNLAALINNKEFDVLIEAYLTLCAKWLKFRMNPYDGATLKLINRAHRRTRAYINKIKQ